MIDFRFVRRTAVHIGGQQRIAERAVRRGQQGQASDLLMEFMQQFRKFENGLQNSALAVSGIAFGAPAEALLR